MLGKQEIFNVTIFFICNTKSVLSLSQLNTLAEAIVKNQGTILCSIELFGHFLGTIARNLNIQAGKTVGHTQTHLPMKISCRECG